MAMVSTLIESTSGSMEKLKEQTKKIAISTGSDIAETAKGLYWTISGGVNQILGYTEQNMLNITKQVSELAAATDADATSATRAIMGVVNTYGEKLGPTIEEQAKRVADVLFQTTFLGITSVQELAQEIGLVTPIWAQMELPIEELGAALAVLTRGGMNTATATTALKSTITEIMKPSEQAAILAQKLGIDFLSLAYVQRGMQNSWQTSWKNKGMPEHLVVLFNNVRSLTEVLGKAGNQDLFLKYLAEVEKSAGSADKAIGKIQKSEAFKEKQLGVRFQVKSEAIGSVLAPVWSDVKKRYLDVMDAITLFVKAYWAEMQGDKTASEAFKSQYESVLNGLPDFLKVAMSLFQKVIIYAYHFGGSVISFYQKISASVVATIMRINASFKFDIISKGIEITGQAWSWFTNVVSEGIVWIIDGIGRIIEYFGKMGKQAESAQEGVSSWSALGEFFSMLGGILTEIGKLFVNIGKVAAAIVGKIVEMEKEWGLVTNVLTAIAVIILAPLYVIGKIIEGTLWLVNLWLEYESQLKGITTIFSLIADGISSIIWALFNPLEALKAGWETLVGIVKGFYNLLIELSTMSIRIGSSIYSTISEWTFGSDKKVVETKKKK
jgi:phage tail tape measure protein, TP901 family, core region